MDAPVEANEGIGRRVVGTIGSDAACYVAAAIAAGVSRIPVAISVSGPIIGVAVGTGRQPAKDAPEHAGGEGEAEAVIVPIVWARIAVPVAAIATTIPATIPIAAAAVSISAAATAVSVCPAVSISAPAAAVSTPAVEAATAAAR
jgi:hypothetical protein